MRTLLELFGILRHQVETNLATGMCGIINYYHKDTSAASPWFTTEEYLFDEDEQELLIEYLNAHRPEFAEEDWYWWPEGEVKPRLEWIDEQIKLLS